MNRKNKIYSGLLTVLFFIALTSFAFTPAGEWIGNTVSGFLNPATEDLDMANNDIKMGTGLIGYNATASKGLSFDSGNEKVTLESGQFILPAGTAAAPSIGIGATNYGFYLVGGDEIRVSSDGSHVFSFKSSEFKSSASSPTFSLRPEQATATNPVYAFNDDVDTGQGTSGADQLSHITGGRETMRMISFADTDVADNEVVVTGVSGYHGLVLVRSLTDDTSAIYRVSNITVVDVSLDGDHTSTETTAGHYNFYYDTDQFKLENKAGAGKSVSVAFWVLPT